MMTRTALLVAVLLAAPGAPASLDDPPPFEPTSRYKPCEVAGWTVLVHRAFLADRPELAGQALALLKSQFDQVARRLPPNAVAKLRTIKIWLEADEPHHPCMAYHPDAGWLVAHGMNPEKACCVEIADAENFLAWTFDQPWMVLHELAHGYHDQFLPEGFGNPEIKEAYKAAMAAGSYRSVLRMSGRSERAYAATDPMEYFAEGTEAYFGTNDFYPFVRPELERHDPGLFSRLGRLWGASIR